MKTTISRGREIKIFLLLFCIIIGNITIMFSQIDNPECGTPNPTYADLSGVYTYETDFSFFPLVSLRF